jgi:hypothetical protein
MAMAFGAAALIIVGVDFESDLQSVAERAKSDEAFAQNLYGALCNMRWVHAEAEAPYHCTWRAASGLVAELRGCDDWLEYYCTGGEGTVSPDVADALARLGWTPLPWD